MASQGALRHVIRRREHRERSQPAARASRFGLLEKHKDYKLRATDYHRKEDAIRTLKEKAAFKNQDEFYMKMNKAKTKNGVHVLERGKTIAPKTLALMKAQDVAYLQMQRSSDATRIEKAKRNMHFLMEDDEDEAPDALDGAKGKGKGKRARDEDDDDEDDDDEDEDEDDAPARKKSKGGAAGSAIRSKHVIFVDSPAAVQNFSAAEYFQTTPDLVKRKFNRLKTEQLAQGSVLLNDTRGQTAVAAAAAAAGKSASGAAAAAASSSGPVSAVHRAAAQSKSAIAASQLLARSDQSLLASYSELSSRLDRKGKIETALHKLQLEKLLAGKGRRKKIVQTEGQFGEVDEKKTVYKWKMERKK